MIKYYLKITIRNIIKDKIYAIINIVGLAIGLTCSFFMLIYVLNEYSYDRMHEKSSRIFRVINENCTAKTKSPGTPLILGPTLIEEFPEIEKIARVNLFYEVLIKKGADYEKSKAFYCADNDVFDIFTFPLKYGDKSRLLTDPNSVVLSEKMAKEYFNEPNPVGKNLEIKYNRKEFLLKVTGIMKDVPKNSTFRPEMLTNISWGIESLKNTFHEDDVATTWGYNFTLTYVLLKENGYISDLQNKIPDFEKRHFNKVNPNKFSFQPLKEIYLHSEDLVNNWAPSGDYKSVKIFSIIAVLILFIAGINYIILSTAHSARRTKEIGMRKVFGANKSMLIRQVLSESVLVSLIALPLAIFLVKIFLPIVNKLFDKELVFTLSESGSYLAGFTIITILIGLFSGSYLSVYLSRLQPISILRNKAMTGNHRNYFRKAMVVFQLIIFIVLSMTTAIVYCQLHYVYTKDMGFNKENLLIINCYDLGEKYIPFKNEIKTNTNIINVCGSMFLPPNNNSKGYYCPRADDPSKKIILEGLAADIDFIKTFQIQIIKGTDYTNDYKTDSVSCILNETAVKELGIKDPINFNINKNSKIIGVVKDFNFHSLHTKIPPLEIEKLTPNSMQYVCQIAVKIKPEGKTESIEYLKNKWKEFSKEPFDYYFIDDMLDDMFKKENKQAKIMRIFSFFAIFIAMLGLFGLSLFTSQQRTKEIGIRKVHGASIGDIMRLLSREYIVLVVIANIIAAPVAYYFMNKWLQNFAYHTEIEWWLFAGVFVLSLVIVLLTISWQAYRAAKTNPVVTLKYE